ncbi:hypothetical protein BVV20_13410 [Xanthomonas oryzae pv. oryzae]|nr:hypothetical protein BVV20_13410 [Xanthomonas oryzae pv. oryzae]
MPHRVIKEEFLSIAPAALNAANSTVRRIAFNLFLKLCVAIDAEMVFLPSPLLTSQKRQQLGACRVIATKLSGDV